MVLNIISLVLFLVFLISFLFFILGASSKWSGLASSGFECGFTSYFFSRFSFSIHYFLVALVFLFLDLELCLLMPMFMDFFSSLSLRGFMFFFISILILTLFLEWLDKKLDWVS